METIKAFQILYQALSEELEKTKTNGTVFFSNGDTKHAKEAADKFEEIQALISVLKDLEKSWEKLLPTTIAEDAPTQTTNVYMANNETKSTGNNYVPYTKTQPLNQRDMMRKLFAQFGNQPDILIKEYAAAERRGEVFRKNNQNDVTPEDYAYVLLADARNKGWLPGFK